MTIKARIYLVTSIILLFIVLVGSIMLWNSHQVETGFDQMVLSSQVTRSAFLLRALMDEYLDQGDERPLRQWNKRYEFLGKIIHDAKSFHSFNPVLLRDLEDKYKHIGPLHAQVIQLGAVENQREQTKALRQTLTGIMSVRLEELVNSAENLQNAAQSFTSRRQRIAQTSTLAACVLMFGLIVLNLYLMRRSVVSPIEKLSRGSEIIGAGNFDHSIELNSKDEVGELAKSFNMMTKNLKKSYDSIRAEMAEREQVQEALQRLNEELEIRVLDRTAELTQARNILEQELRDRKLAEGALRESEERLRLAQSSANVGIWDWNLRSGEVTWTKELERMHGYAEGAFPGTYEAFSQRVHPDDLAQIQRRREEAVRESKPYDFDFRILLPSGETRWVNCKGSAHYDETGEPDRILGVNADITDRKRAEEALRKAHDELELRVRERTSELEAKNLEMERFVYTVSHDLKSPLITINTFLGFVSEDVAGGNRENLQADVERIYKATDKMGKLLNEILELSRIGRMVNPPSEAPMADVVNNALEIMSGRLVQSGLEISLAPGLPNLYGDRPRLEEVFQNLIENSLKFMGDQPHPRIEIGVRTDNGEQVIFVRDNGDGIDPLFHEKVFGLFDKLDPKSEGTGIGLALVKRIVEVHGGRIWVESDGVGHGSTFCFTLPGPGQPKQ